MGYWKPKKYWEGRDVYIIGGGASLKTFDWNLLKDKRVIGCNLAGIYLGSKICPVNIFGDGVLFNTKFQEFSEYRGLLITCDPSLVDTKHSFLKVMKRQNVGIDSTGEALGWNSNTGTAAINLALHFGAFKIMLLGFDMKLTDGFPNWYPRVEKATENIYETYIPKYDFIKKEIDKKFPGHFIYNITNDSDLNCFPKISVAQHFKGTTNGI